ncbi:phasin family protein [Micromonospora sp. DT47]|uniref:phasin family protein n=1 Tax=Micromonospora sp. DT47 TaxID=3393431 RepID=UPI003CF73E1C
MQDAWRAYLELAMGLTEAPRKRAQDAVRRLVGTGGATAAQIQALAEELLSTSAANREALTKLVRFEVDRALGAVGLATADEVAELTRRVHELERHLREAKGGGFLPGTPAAGVSAPGTSPAGGAVTGPSTGDGSGADASRADASAPASTKAVAKKAVAKKSIAKKPPAAVSTTAGEDVVPAARPAKKDAPRKRTTGGAE